MPENNAGMPHRPACYPEPSRAAVAGDARRGLPLLDAFVSPVPEGVFPSPVDDRHVLCLHLGDPVPVSYRWNIHDRHGVRLLGQFCVVPAGASTRWILSRPATSLLLRLSPAILRDAAEAMGLDSHGDALAPAIHLRDAQVERIGWMMKAEARDGHPGGRLFADSLASALASRLLSLESRRPAPVAEHRNALPAWRLRQVLDYIEAHLDQDLTLAELAETAGFSVSHFKSLFKRTVGMPAHQFVLRRRARRAQAHLRDGRMSRTQVALETGFAHPSHMARCLRRFATETFEDDAEVFGDA